MYLFKHKDGREVRTNNDQMIRIMLELHGGGMTARQTMNAMIAVNKVQDGVAVVVKKAGWTVTKEPEPC